MLKRSQLNFRGNIEGHDLFADPVEVVVCDGFVGNVILKTCESVGDAIFRWLKHELTRASCAWPARFSRKTPSGPSRRKRTTKNTAASPLFGVNGICIIAHGASTPLAIKNALRVAAESIEQQVNPHIIEEVSRYNETQATLEPAVR